MNAAFDDGKLEFTAVDVEPTKQSNDPPPEFIGTKPSEIKSYREKVKQSLLFTRTPAQLQGPRVLSRLTGPAWDACDGLEAEGVATADGVNVILDSLAEAFQVNMKRKPRRTLSCGPSGRRVRGSTTMHFVYKPTYESWPSTKYGCQPECRDFYCCVERT